MGTSGLVSEPDSEPDSGSGTGDRCDKPYGHTDSAAHVFADVQAEVKNNEEPCGASHHTLASDRVNMENNTTFRSTTGYQGWYRGAGNSFWVKFIVGFFLVVFALGDWLANTMQSLPGMPAVNIEMPAINLEMPAVNLEMPAVNLEMPAVKPLAAIFVTVLVFSVMLVSGCCIWPCFKQSFKVDNLGASSCCDYPESSGSGVKEIDLKACKEPTKPDYKQTSTKITEDDEVVDISSECDSQKESSGAGAEFSSKVHMLILVSVSVLVVVAFAVLFPWMVCNLQKMDPPYHLPSIKFSASRSLSSNYTNAQWLVGTSVTVSSALLKVVTVFALSFSCLVIEVLSSASQFLTFRRNVDRKASSAAIVTTSKSSYRFLNVARAVTFMVIFAGQIPLVGSESLTNATNANHSICLPSDRPVYQCGLQPPEYVCSVSLRYEHNGLDLSPLIVNHILIPEFVKNHHPSPKHLVSLTYLKSPYAIPSAAENKVIVPLLCASVFFLGPCFPYLAIIYFLVNPIAAKVFWRCYNWFIGIVWDYGVSPFLLWLRGDEFGRVKCETKLVLNGAIQIVLSAPRAFYVRQAALSRFLQSILLSTLIAAFLCSSVGLYGEALVSAVPYTLPAMSSLSMQAYGCILSASLPTFAHVMVSLLFLAMANVCILILGVLVDRMGRAVEKLQAATNVVLNGASWLFRGAVFILRPHFAPFLLLSLVSVAKYACAGWYGEVISSMLTSFDSRLLEMSGFAAILALVSVAVLQPLFVELVPPPGGVDGRDHVRLAEYLPPPPREIIQPSPREIIQPSPREIIQPSVRPKPGSNLRKRGVGFLVYDTEDHDRVVQDRDASTPHFVGSHRLRNPRPQLCYLPEPTFLVLHGKPVTIEEPSDGPILSTDIGHRSAAFDHPCISVASLVECDVSSALLRSFEEEADG